MLKYSLILLKGLLFMEKNTENAINVAKSMMDTSAMCRYNVRSNYSCYDYFYSFTNENINAYTELIDNNPQSALTVLASGDQPYNLITKGILDIDTFDINLMTEFYALGLKRAMILKYNHDEFINIVLKIMRYQFTIEEEIEFIIDLLPYMDTEYRLFWKTIVDYFIKLISNVSISNIPFVIKL